MGVGGGGGVELKICHVVFKRETDSFSFFLHCKLALMKADCAECFLDTWREQCGSLKKKQKKLSALLCHRWHLKLKSSTTPAGFIHWFIHFHTPTSYAYVRY